MKIYVYAHETTTTILKSVVPAWYVVVNFEGIPFANRFCGYATHTDKDEAIRLATEMHNSNVEKYGIETLL